MFLTAPASIAALQPPYRVEHRFFGAMPTGVAVSRRGRLFVTMPRWGDPVKATVVELKDGREVPYPDKSHNDFFGRPTKERFVSVQSVVVDAKDRLWALDTGSVKLGPNTPGLPRLWCFDLRTNRATRVYTFPESVVPTTTYLNDVRFDLTRGKAGYAFLTDSSAYGHNRIVVLNLATGESRARLVDHPSVRPDQADGTPLTMKTAEGYPLLVRPKPGVVKKPTLGADGLAIFPDEDRLVWCPLISRQTYEAPISALVDPDVSDEDLAAKVRTALRKPASDGLHEAPNGALLATDYENARILEFRGTTPRTLLQAPRYEWPDTLSVANGRVYAILNQLQRQKEYHEGKDLRKKPYRLVSFPYRPAATGRGGGALAPR